MNTNITVDQIKNEFFNPNIKKGDYIIDPDGNVFITGWYQKAYVINMNTGEDSYNNPKLMPEKYKKLKKGDSITIQIA